VGFQVEVVARRAAGVVGPVVVEEGGAGVEGDAVSILSCLGGVAISRAIPDTGGG